MFCLFTFSLGSSKPQVDFNPANIPQAWKPADYDQKNTIKYERELIKAKYIPGWVGVCDLTAATTATIAATVAAAATIAAAATTVFYVPLLLMLLLISFE